MRDISELKDEPEWMTEIRSKFHHFMKVEMPKWGNTELLESINFDNVTYFLRSSDMTEKSDDVPEDIKNTFNRLEFDRTKWLVVLLLNMNQAVYHSIREDLEEQGVTFLTWIRLKQ